MRRRSSRNRRYDHGGRYDRSIIELLFGRFYRELEAISDYLYFSALCEGEYGELSSELDLVAQLHSKNMKRIGALLVSMGQDPVVNCHVSTRFATSALEGDGIESILVRLADSERKDIAAYERIAELYESEPWAETVNQILCESRERADMLERILRS